MKKTTPKTKPAKPKRPDPLALRHSLRLTQSEFWRALGVGQSAGSRYESGRKMPPPTAMLFDLVYVKALDLERIEACDISILRYLEENQPDLYATLTRAVRSNAASLR